MNVPLEWQTVILFLERHWISAFFLAITFLTLGLLLALRWWIRRRLNRLLEAEYPLDDVEDDLPSITPEDERALEAIKAFRREVWQLPDRELQLGLESLSQRAVLIVRTIAAIYHPHAEIPHYQASLVELLQLVRRVAARLVRLGTVTPFTLLTYRKLSDYQRFYDIYRKINESPLLSLLKRNRYLYRVARWAVNLRNLGNPLYWAGREISRESYFFLMRWFYAAFASQVGREAMKLYSGRHFQSEDHREAAMICFRLFALAREWNGPSPSEWAALVEFVVTHPLLEADAKTQVLLKCCRNGLPEDLAEQKIETRLARKWYRQGLKRLLKVDGVPSKIKEEWIARELSLLEEPRE
jgi:hypothetical protein